MGRLLTVVLALAAASPAFAAVDGAQVFASQCRACHGAKSAPTGPALTGVAGAKIAGRPDFNYSAALKAKGEGVWTDGELDAFLKSPRAYAPGTRMPLGVASPERRLAVIEYLKTLK